jgi:threonine dehydratase
MTSSTLTEPDLALPTAADVAAAADRIAGAAVLTPLLESARLNARVGGRLLIKPECLQRTGAFKFRGAYNRLSQLDAAARRAGVIAYSSGNHAQAVAAAAQLLSIPAVIVMPSDAPRIKLDNTRWYGAEVVLYDRHRESREDIAATLVRERGGTVVPPYDDPHIIAGQGTVGRELAAQAAALDAGLDAVLVPCGGGGLSAGCALALHAATPDTALYVVEPQGFDDTTRSLAAGSRQQAAPGATSLCDGLLPPTPGELTFAINRKLLAGGLVVDDDAVAGAMAAAFTDLKIVMEPSGAVGLAAVLAGQIDARGRCLGIVCSGGNVDAETFTACLDRARTHPA